MRTAFSVSKSVPAKVAAIVIPVAASGPIEVVMSKIESFYFSDSEDSGEAIFKAFA